MASFIRSDERYRGPTRFSPDALFLDLLSLSTGGPSPNISLIRSVGTQANETLAEQVVDDVVVRVRGVSC